MSASREMLTEYIKRLKQHNWANATLFRK